MAALLALMWAVLGGVVFTLLCMGLFVLTDPAHWRRLFKAWRRHTYLSLRTYARRTHVQRKPIRSGIAWWLADRFERSHAHKTFRTHVRTEATRRP